MSIGSKTDSMTQGCSNLLNVTVKWRIERASKDTALSSLKGCGKDSQLKYCFIFSRSSHVKTASGIPHYSLVKCFSPLEELHLIPPFMTTKQFSLHVCKAGQMKWYVC